MPLFRGNNYPHEVHSHDCGYLPRRANRLYFTANSFAKAIRKAQQYYGTADPCGHCLAQRIVARRRQRRRKANRRYGRISSRRILPSPS